MPSGIRCPQPTTLTLIRHGQSQANVERCFGGHSLTPLTEQGRREAQATAEHVAARSEETPARFIYSSDLPRALQTAEPIASALGLEVIATAGLRERSVGELDGQPFQVAQEERPEIWKGLLGRDPDWRPPGGETVREAFERMHNCLREILHQHPGEGIVAVTHAIAIHLGINALLDLGSADAMGVYFKVSNASRSTFVVGPTRTQVSCINQIDHLSPGSVSSI